VATHAFWVVEAVLRHVFFREDEGNVSRRIASVLVEQASHIFRRDTVYGDIHRLTRLTLRSVVKAALVIAEIGTHFLATLALYVASWRHRCHGSVGDRAEQQQTVHSGTVFYLSR
jgi:hypothetical protein